MLFGEFQDGHHGYRNGMILAILNLYVAPMPPIKFRLNLTYGLGGDAVWRISRWLPSWRPPWISEWNDFSNSESLCHCDASHQVSVQSDLIYGLWGDVVWRISRWPPWGPSWILEWNDSSNSESLYVIVTPPIKFWLNLTYGLGGDVVWRISRWRPSWISERNDFSNSESLCRYDAFH